MLIPPGCVNNSTIVDRLRGAQSEDQVITELCLEHNFSDPTTRYKSHQIFLEYFEAAKDPQWLSQHQQLGEKLIEKAFEVIHSANNQDVRARYIQVVRESLPAFRTAIPSLKEENVEISTRNKMIKANSLLLSSQSTVYKGLFSGNGSYTYKADLSNENPRVIKAVIRATQTLQLPKEKSYTTDEYKDILGYAASVEIGPSVFPLFEENMKKDLTVNNAYDMAVLAKKHGLNELLIKALEMIEPTIHEHTWIETLEKAKKDGQQEVIDLALNAALDRLPSWIANKETDKIALLKDNLQHMTVLASDVIHVLLKNHPETYRELLTKKLPPNLQKINLAGCDFKLAPDLKRFPTLYDINLENCKNLLNISNLKDNKGLKFLNLNGCAQLKNLAPLANNPKLSVMRVQNCPSMDSDSLQFLLKPKPHSNISDIEIIGWESNAKLNAGMANIQSYKQKILVDISLNR